MEEIAEKPITISNWTRWAVLCVRGSKQLNVSWAEIRNEIRKVKEACFIDYHFLNIALSILTPA